jgi:hypothetical protein
MNSSVRRNLPVLPPILTALLALVLAMGYTFTAAGAALAEAPTTFRIPHEVQYAGMLVVDLNGDGKKEIITGSIDGYVTVVDGAFYHVAWDKNMADYLPGYDHTRIQAGLAAADLDNDGRIELVVATGGADPINGDGPGAIIVLTYVGDGEVFQLAPGWPVMAFDELGAKGDLPDGHPDGFTSTPALGDIDGDGTKEIVIGGMDRRLHAFHYNGTYVAGWPLAREYGISRDSRSTAALADLDGDGVLDILIGSNNFSIPFCANPYLFYGMKGTSVPLPGWPYSTTQNIESSPAIGDINNDGSVDVVFGTGDFYENCGQPSDGKKVYALNRFGQPLPGWPVRTNANMVNSPALGDLDNDGTPEVVIHTQDTLYAWHGDGSLVQGFPVHGEYNLRHASPVLADVDGDSQIEIVLASGQVYGPTGELEQQRNKLQSQVVVTDQDGDGLLEIIGANHFNYNIGLHLMVYIFQEEGSANSAQPWPMFHRTIDRTGVLPILFTLSGRIVDESNQGVGSVKVTLDNGQIALTDDDGNYIFGSMPAGDYVVTPSYQNYLFQPKERSLHLGGNTTVETIVMREPVYDIAGRVLQANNSPLAGVTLQLSTGIQAKTAKDGFFFFADQQPGEYTLAPVAPDLVYTPEESVLVAEDETFQIFYALPKPVVDALTPESASQVSFNDTQGLPTSVTFPEGLGPDEAVVTPVLPADPNGYRTTGHAIDIALTSEGVNAQPNVVGQNGEPLSIEIRIQYSAADLQNLLNPEELTLLWLSPDGWVDAQATCPAGNSVDNNLATQTITLGVCQWGTYGLFAPVNSLYMPSVYGAD